MNRIVNKRSVSKRVYASALREERAQETRDRILDGVLEAMKDGLAELSVPAVAKAARVSVPTVYRHFPTKRALFDAVGAHIGRRTGLSATPPAVTNLDEFGRWVHETFARLDGVDSATAAAMAGALGGEVRRKTLMPRRLALYETALAPALAALPPDERDHLRRVAVLLTSSGALRVFKSYLDLTPAQAADTVMWTLGVLVEAAQGRGAEARPPAKRGKTRKTR
jgi:AcrR family transcriptional regulator